MAKEILNLSLKSTEILDKKFKGAKNGYDSYEVDEYLDKVLSDYRLVEEKCLLNKKYYANIIKENEELKKTNEYLEISLKSYQDKLDGISDISKATSSNIDLLKRINKLEKFLWKEGFNPNNIK